MRINFIYFLFLFISLNVNSQEVTHKHSIHHSFIENKGQWNENVLFKSHFDGGNLWVEQHRLLFHLQDFGSLYEAHVSMGKQKKQSTEVPQSIVYLNFLNSNDVSEIETFFPSSNYYNYFLGNKKENWATNVRGYGEAIMKDLYDGIDFKIIEQKEQLKYEFHVKPMQDPNLIRLQYRGHEKLSLNKKGDLIIKSSLGEIIEQKPYAYQIVNGRIREVTCEFVVDEDRVRFKLGKYNPNATLVIDPVLIFATYSGSPSDNFGMTATYAHDGSAYSGGTVFGNAYPTPAASYDTVANLPPVYGVSYGVTDVFISKYSPDGTQMLWTCFLGGGNDTIGTETVHSLIADENDNLYLFGATSSIDFPIQNGYQSVHGGGVAGANFYFNGVFYKDYGTDIYVAKLSSDGLNLLGSTYLGGSDNDGVNYSKFVTYNSVAAYDSLTPNYGDQFRGEIMIDSVGNCLVATCSQSSDFPILNAFQNSNAGRQDGVIFKLSSDLSSLMWSSYFGGAENDACYSVKIDSKHNVLFSGGTSSNNIPNLGTGWKNVYQGGKTDGFVAKLAPDGASVIGSTYLGDTLSDQAYFVELDRIDRVYVLGQSFGGLFPVINATFVNPNSSQFILRLDETLATPLNSTVFGNGGYNPNISPSAFLVDICGNIYVSGWGANILQSTPLNGMSVTSDALYATPPNGFDFYIMAMDNQFSNLIYGSYFGEPGTIEEHVDGGTSRFDKNGVIYQSVCGACGTSTGGSVTTPSAWSQTDLSTNCNNLVFKFDFEIIPSAEFTVDNAVGCRPFSVNFTNTSNVTDTYLWDFGNNDTTSVIYEPIKLYDSVGVFQVYLYVTDSACLLSDTAEITINVYDSLQLSTTADVVICSPVSTSMTAFTNGSGNQFIWSSNSGFTDTLNLNIADSVFTTTPVGNMTYYVKISNGGCSMIDSVNVQVTNSSLILSANDSICVGDQTTVTATSSNQSITFNNFVWSNDSIIVSPSTSSSVIVDPLVSQYVYVSATSSSGCIATDSIQIHVGHVPQSLVSATASDYTVPIGGTTTLLGNPSGYSYQWLPTAGLSSPNSLNTDAEMQKTTLFTFLVSDGICTKSDTVLVQVYDFQCDDPNLFVPNAFTPNGDGENDVLYVRGEAIKEMVFRIYDRWGELIFESYERPFGWDGTYKGKMMNPDVYDYYLKVTCIDNVESIVKGNVTLIR